MTPEPAENTKPILIVDDDQGQLNLLQGFLSRQGYEILRADRGEKAVEILDREAVAMVISDVRMPGMTGLDLLREIRRRHARLPVLLVTGYADVRDAVEAMRDGAANYLEKPIDLDELLSGVRHALGSAAPMEAAIVDKVAPPPGVVAESPAMRDVLREIALVAPTDSRVLITGESGSGKEVVADLLHAHSPRAGKPFVKVNCAAIPETLLESELLGHEKGSFTGATERRLGCFEQANGGTILLDEIGEMTPSVQAKLLRVTQDGTFRRVGGSQTIQVDVRILASTNRDLEEDLHNGHFREDLYYRLNVFEIYLPPLRERAADVLPLANLFAAKFSGGKPRFSAAAVAALETYTWPGNVRELQNAMERAALMAHGGVILPEHLPRRIQPAASATDSPDTGKRPKIEDIERSVILQTLRDNQYNRSETARVLGISRRTLIYKLHRFREQGYVVEPVGSDKGTGGAGGAE